MIPATKKYFLQSIVQHMILFEHNKRPLLTIMLAQKSGYKNKQKTLRQSRSNKNLVEQSILEL